MSKTLRRFIGSWLVFLFSMGPWLSVLFINKNLRMTYHEILHVHPVLLPVWICGVTAAFALFMGVSEYFDSRFSDEASKEAWEESIDSMYYYSLLSLLVRLAYLVYGFVGGLFMINLNERRRKQVGVTNAKE